MTQRKRLWILAGAMICLAMGVLIQGVVLSSDRSAVSTPPCEVPKNTEKITDAQPSQKLPLACHLVTVWFKKSGQKSQESYSDRTLEGVIPILKQNETASVRVEGYSDQKGDRKVNLSVSKGRAEKVVSFLNKQGIANERIKVCPYGEDYPLVPQSTPDTTVNENRRVELWLIWKEHDITNGHPHYLLNSRCYFLLPGGLSDNACFQPGNHHAGSTKQDSQEN